MNFNSLATQLYTARVAQKISRAEIGKLFNLAGSSVRRMELGETSLRHRTPVELQAWAEAVGCRIVFRIEVSK